MSEHAARILAGLALACAALVAAGISHPRPESLADHVARLWDARHAEDWSVVFDYQDPAIIADGTREQYIEWASENEPFIIREYRILEVVEQGDLGYAHVTSKDAVRRFQHVPARDVSRWEVWHRIDGTWRPVSPFELDNYPEAPPVRNLAIEDDLRARFLASWDARMKGNWDDFHAMIDPHDQARVPLDGLYGIAEELEFISGELQWVQALSNRGEVRFLATTRIVDPSMSKIAPTSKLITEPWVYIDGVWYLDAVPEGS
ncbi:MAG: hypothetical protein KC983_00300 [Phycisphaerales bacterium]|nr:hypothetical protein [Phycisphaerales bacterium]